MASGGVVSPSPIIRTQPADSSTMSTSSPTDLLRQHEEEALLPTPLSSLPGAVLVELRDHQPLVYDTMLLYDRLLATSEARTHAKEGELLRCIHVGQELMEQMGALNRRCTTLATERDAMERRVKEAERRSANMDSPIIFRSAVAPRSSTHEGAAQPSTSFSPPPPPTATQQQPASGSSSSSSMDHDHESLQAANEVCELLRCMLARCSSSSSADDVVATPRGGLREVLEASMAMARRLEEHNSTRTSDVVVPVIDGTNHQQGVRAPDEDAKAVMMNLEELRRRCDAALAEMRSPSSALEMERQRISRTRARLDVEMSMGMCSAQQREELAAMMDELDTARVAVEEKAIASAAAAAEANIASSSSSSSMNPVEVVRMVMESVEAMRRAHHESMEEVQHACVELHDEIDHQHGQRVRATTSSASTQVAQREGVADLQRRLDTSLADAKGLRVVLAQEARKNEELARAQQQHEEEMALMRSELRAAGELAEEQGHIAATRAADVARLEEVNAGMTTSLNELRGQTVELQAAVDGLLSMERTRMEVAEAGAMEAKDAYATEMHHLQHRVLLLEEELVLTKESVQRSRLAAQSAAELSASVVAAEVEQHNKHHREELRRAVAAREEAEARVRTLEATHSQMQQSAADAHQRAEGAREEMEELRKHLHDVFARLMEDMASHVRPIAAQHNTAVMEATAVALDRSREVLACAEAALHQVELYAHNTSSLDEHHHLAQDSATDYWLGRAHALRQLEMEANSAPPSPAKPRSTSHTPEKMMTVPPPPPLSSTSCAAEEAQRRRADFWEAALFPSSDMHESGVVFDVWRLASDMWHGLVRHQAERVRSLVMKARTRSVAITDEDGASSCTWPAEVFEVVASIMSELVALATLANTQAIQCGVHLQEQLHHAQEAQLPLQRLRHAGVDEEAMHVVHMRAAEASRIRLDECVEELCRITRGAVEEQVEAHRRELALQSAVASARGGAACDA